MLANQWPFELPQEPAAIVSNNNTPHWTVIVETKPNVTLDLGTKLYTQEQVNACITAALRWAAEEVRREVLIELHNRCIPASAAAADAVRRRVQSVLLRE